MLREISRAMIFFAAIVACATMCFAQVPPSPGTIVGHPLADLTPDAQTKVNLALSDLSAIGHPEVAAAVANGLTIKGYSISTGCSDHDTIGVDVDQTPEAIAATLLHEYGHVQHDLAAGTDNDPTTGTSSSTVICNHADMYIQTAQTFCHLCAENATIGCSEVEQFTDAAAAAAQACTGSGGSVTEEIPDPQDCGCHN
jgi:hypothetical protein